MEGNSRVIRLMLCIAAFACALLVWGAFYPGFMNADSLVQYYQSVNGKYDDWHPPIIAITLHYVMKLGLSVGFITLLQTLMGFAGILLLSSKVLQLVDAPEKTRLYLPFIILFVLLLPITPMPFYLMYFSKDAWSCIGFIWISWLSLVLYAGRKNVKFYYLFYLLLCLFMTTVLLVRHNAVVLAPVFFLMLFFIATGSSPERKFRLINLVPGVLLVAFYLACNSGIYNYFKVERLEPGNQIIALESVGMLVNNIDNKEYLPYTYKHLTPNYRQAYIAGNVTPVMWYGKEKAVDSTFNEDTPELKGQYFGMITKAPFSLIKVKWDGFKNMIWPPYKKVYLCHTQIDQNTAGIKLNEGFKPFRDAWIKAVDFFHQNKVTRMWFDEHFTWILANLALIWALYRQRLLNRAWIGVLLLPLAYYFSYLLACPSDDYRYMYPSTLLIQVITFSLGTVWYGKWRHRKKLLSLASEKKN